VDSISESPQLVDERLELVSIVVITFNAAPYVVETLDSAFRQTYASLELIIADDGSSDETVNVCRQWLDSHAHRFQRVELIGWTTNTGTSCNANRGMRAATGKWLKIIAGDDILDPNGIQHYVNHINIYPTQRILFANQTPFVSEYLYYNMQQERSHADEWFYNPSCSARQQFLFCLFKYTLHSPTMFMHREVFEKVGGYDEEMRIIEDMAFYFSVLLSGERMYYVNKNTVFYRVHPSSSSHNTQSKVVQFKEADRALRYRKYIQPHAGPITLYLHNMLMRVYYKKSKPHRWLKETLVHLAITAIKKQWIR
jgi:glycosyltransferase involved in cell wall biosynthesis